LAEFELCECFLYVVVIVVVSVSVVVVEIDLVWLNTAPLIAFASETLLFSSQFCFVYLLEEAAILVSNRTKTAMMTFEIVNL